MLNLWCSEYANAQVACNRAGNSCCCEAWYAETQTTSLYCYDTFCGRYRVFTSHTITKQVIRWLPKRSYWTCIVRDKSVLSNSTTSNSCFVKFTSQQKFTMEFPSFINLVVNYALTHSTAPWPLFYISYVEWRSRKVWSDLPALPLDIAILSSTVHYESQS